MSESKEVSEFFGGSLPTVTSKLTQSLAALKAASKSAGGAAFMKFTKQGEWVYGVENIEVPATERWAVNPHSLVIGVIGWSDGNLVGEYMYPIASGQRPDYNALQPITSNKDGDGWKDQLGLVMKSLDDGTEVRFATSSKGGKNAIAELAGEIATHTETDIDTPVPVVHLLSDFYKHKSYGKIYTPIFKIVDWITLEGKPRAAKTERKKLV